MQQDEYPKVYLYRRMVQAKLFIDSHFAERIDLNSISEEAYFSKFHFMRLFKKVYGKTPHRYLTTVRIEKAKLFLREEVRVVEVCSAVGFDSISSFTTLFKRQTGMTPSVFQIHQHARQQAIGTEPLRFIPNCFAENNGWVNSANK